MPSNFLLRKRDDNTPPVGNRLLGRAGDERENPVRPGTAAEPDAGFVPVDTRGGQPTSPTTMQPAKLSVPVFSNAPSPTDELGSLINTPLSRLPSFQRAMDARQKRIALEAMPTYTDSKGKVQQGMQDHDGRLQSGLKGLVQGMAENFSGGGVRDWNDFAGRLTGTIGRGIGGAIVPEWNEWQERSQEIARLRAEEQDAMKGVEWESKMATAQVNRDDKVADNDRQQKGLDDRIARHKMQNMKDEQKMLLEPIFKRGYYYEGDNPQEDEALAKSGLILPDFDNSRKPITDNGVRKAWNPEKRTYEQMQGSEVDPDDVPMTFVVDGEKITASSKYFLNYKAGVERQKSQQTFQAGENEKNRQVQWARIKQAAEQFKARTANEVVARRAAIQKALEAGDIQQPEADELLDILKRNNPDFFQ